MNIRNYNDAEVMDAMQFMEQIMINENLNNVSFTKDKTIEEIYNMFVSCYDEFCDEYNFTAQHYGYFGEFAHDWLLLRQKIYNMHNLSENKNIRLFIDERYGLDTIFTIDELKGEWKAQVADDATDLSFKDYLTNCLSINGGTLTEINF